MENVLVNFRIPERRLALVRQRAARQRLTVSAFIRDCVEDALRRSADVEEKEELWKNELPPAVRDMIGLAEGFSVDDNAERSAYHDYLSEKYA